VILPKFFILRWGTYYTGVPHYAESFFSANFLSGLFPTRKPDTLSLSVAFALPATGTLGSIGRANIQGPGTWQFDAALSRIFVISERQKVEGRLEMYNVTNSFRPGNPNTSLNSFTFGRIISSLDPRVTQLTVKYIF